MTLQQLVKWKAFRKIQPDPMDRLCDILKIGLASFGGELSPDDFEPCLDKRKPEPSAGPGAAQQIVAPLMGQSNGDSNR
jgi:hypothetical protein